MPHIEPFTPRGMLHDGWSAQVNDYAIVCGWSMSGKIFNVGDASGDIHAFNGIEGESLWVNKSAHKGGLLGMSINQDGNILASSGQDGFVRYWNSEDGKEINKIQ